MHVFISWSGPRSLHVANALARFLPQVIQALRPWSASDSIRAGVQWRKHVMENLDKASAGIVCVTPENQGAPWLNFEAGCLAKTVTDEPLVCTYLIGMSDTDLRNEPLRLFQHKTANRDGTLAILKALNSALPDVTRLENEQLELQFGRVWPELEQQLAQIPEAREQQLKKRTTEEILEDLVLTVRSVEEALPSLFHTSNKSNMILRDLWQRLAPAPVRYFTTDLKPKDATQLEAVRERVNQELAELRSKIGGKSYKALLDEYRKQATATPDSAEYYQDALHYIEMRLDMG